VSKDFNETIDHGGGRFTLFGRVLADMPGGPTRQKGAPSTDPCPAGDQALSRITSSTPAWSEARPAIHAATRRSFCALGLS
jgi:hypothetical protein